MATLEFESMAARGLRRYVRLVERALGFDGYGHHVQLEAVSSVYLPLTDRLARYPDRDVALLWDERQGWSLGVENAIGGEIVTIACLTSDVLPPPSEVADFVDRVFAGDRPDEPESPTFRTATDELAQRLAHYAMPGVGPAPTTVPLT